MRVAAAGYGTIKLKASGSLSEFEWTVVPEAAGCSPPETANERVNPMISCPALLRNTN